MVAYGILHGADECIASSSCVCQLILPQDIMLCGLEKYIFM